MTNILVGTANGLHEIGGAGGPRHEGREVNAITKASDGWWAAVDGRELWHGESGDWEKAAVSDRLRINCLLEQEGELLAGMAEARLFQLDGDALAPVTAFDDTDGRDTWGTPWGGPPDVRSMSRDPNGAVFANVHVGGIPRSVDAGGWRPTIEVGADVHQVVYDPRSNLLLAPCAKGLAVSADAGESWRYDVDGVHGRYMRAAATTKQTLFVTASTGPYSDRAAVYRRPIDDSGPFEKCADGLPEWFNGNVDTYCIAADDELVAFGLPDGAVYSSEDEGVTWTRRADGLPEIRCLALG